MRPKLLILLTIIVAAPMAALVALGAKLVHDETKMAQIRLEELLVARLTEVDRTIAQVLEEQARAVEAEAPDDLSLGVLREASRRSPRVRLYFVLNEAGELMYPNATAAPIEREREFFDRSRELWRNPLQMIAPAEASAEQQGATRAATKAPSPSSGWFTWYWGNGIQFIHWWRSGNVVVGAELNRTRLISEIVAALPQTAPDASAADGRTVLLDSQGTPVYQWGVYSPAPGEGPAASVPLRFPLSSWSLASYMPAAYARAGYGAGTGLAVTASLAALALVVIGTATYFYREHTRELREAGQRVTFVNQVSHELKTPLTNIRLYAELLEQELEESHQGPRQYLNTIVTESQRLSRLIGNVLTFSRKGRNGLRLQPRAVVVDEVIAGVVNHLDEPLRQKGIAVRTELDAPRAIQADPDALAQILANLLSNVEKYAHGADHVLITSSQTEDQVSVRVSDNGPGVPPSDHERIFEAFYRVSNRLTDGVAGTGIGLTIARDLARLHGGDLQLVSGAAGATFELMWKTKRDPGVETE